MSVDERNEQARLYVENKLNFADARKTSYFNDINDLSDLDQILQSLIFQKADGFRGVVLTALTGIFLDADYDPLTNFYSCNPRSIFEKGIYYALEGRIPTRLSAPLNVAKNQNVLDEVWVQGRRPQAAAQAAVDYLRWLAECDASEREKVIDYYFFKLTEFARSVKSILVEIPDQSESQRIGLGSRLERLVLEYPESGTIPQLVVSSLLASVYEFSNISVLGGDESVFGTNTTSKKPADIWLERDDVVFNLYEVTVKKVDLKRLDDCVRSLNSVSMLDLPVHFVCRLSVDVSELSGMIGGTYNHRGKLFQFVDIGAFIHSLEALLSDEQVDNLMEKLREFIGDLNRPIATKEGWNTIFGSSI